jgi:hypothetical protein
MSDHFCSPLYCARNSEDAKAPMSLQKRFRRLSSKAGQRSYLPAEPKDMLKEGWMDLRSEARRSDASPEAILDSVSSIPRARHSPFRSHETISAGLSRCISLKVPQTCHYQTRVLTRGPRATQTHFHQKSQRSLLSSSLTNGGH